MVYKSRALDRDVYSLALERMEYTFDTFDHVCVSFSGGKDSTAVLNVALEVARQKNKLPLRVISYDEEAIPPETVDYMTRVSEKDDVEFDWYCVPIEHRNACSRKQPYWYPWNPDKRNLWCRDLPDKAITDIPNFKRTGIPNLMGLIAPRKLGSVAMVMGIRAMESQTRRRSVTVTSGFTNFIANSAWNHIKTVKPVYDWSNEDVWRAPNKFDWDYNRAYDVMQKMGVSLHLQRCAPPFGDQPVKALPRFKKCWPELWSKMVHRVHGAATAGRYATTKLYQAGKREKPEGMTYKEWTLSMIEQLEGKNKLECQHGIRLAIKTHRRTSEDKSAIPDETPHPMSGLSWKVLSLYGLVGSDKLGRTSQRVSQKRILNKNEYEQKTAADR